MSWVATAIVGGTALSAGGSYLGAQTKTTPGRFELYPEYQESEGARKKLSRRLEEWGGQPGYGAISPDWADIWERTQRRVKQYYWGSAMGDKGLAGKVKSSAAARGVSDSPAMESLLGRMGITEAQQLQDLSTEQGLQEANLSEKGRQDWITEMFSLANMKPNAQYIPEKTEQKYPGVGEAMGTIGSALGSWGSGKANINAQNSQNQWLQNMMKGSNYPGGYAPSGYDDPSWY